RHAKSPSCSCGGTLDISTWAASFAAALGSTVKTVVLRLVATLIILRPAMTYDCSPILRLTSSLATQYRGRGTLAGFSRSLLNISGAYALTRNRLSSE